MNSIVGQPQKDSAALVDAWNQIFPGWLSGVDQGHPAPVSEHDFSEIAGDKLVFYGLAQDLAVKAAKGREVKSGLDTDEGYKPGQNGSENQYNKFFRDFILRKGGGEIGLRAAFRLLSEDKRDGPKRHSIVWTQGVREVASCRLHVTHQDHGGRIILSAVTSLLFNGQGKLIKKTFNLSQMPESSSISTLSQIHKAACPENYGPEESLRTKGRRRDGRSGFLRTRSPRPRATAPVVR